MEQGRQDLETKLIQKAWADEVFRQELLADPKGVVEREIGQSLPDDVEVKVVEESTKLFYFRLPINPDDLPEVIIDLVAGGGSTCDTQCNSKCPGQCVRNY